MHTYIYDTDKKEFVGYIRLVHDGSEFYFPEEVSLSSIVYSIYEEKGRDAVLTVLLNYFVHDVDSVDCHICDCESLAFNYDASHSCVICGHRAQVISLT